MHKVEGLAGHDPRRDAISVSWVLRICTYVGSVQGPDRLGARMYKIGGRWAANGVAPPFDPLDLYIRGIGVGARSAMGMYVQKPRGSWSTDGVVPPFCPICQFDFVHTSRLV